MRAKSQWNGKRVVRKLALVRTEHAVVSSWHSGQAVSAMKLNYYAETDSLYIDLSEKPSVESREISEGVVLDYDAMGNLVGIDIDNASSKVQLDQLIVNKLPSKVQTVAA